MVSSDKATVVSICPFPINEFKPGLFPSTFNIPPAEEGDVQVLNIPNTVYYRIRMPVINQMINVPVPAMECARSIVNDRASGQLVASSTAKPGLFWLPGWISKEEVKLKYKKELDEADRMQKAWYVNLVKLADDDFNKTKQHKFISDLQRHAAKVLKVKKEWATDPILIAALEKKCVACFAPLLSAEARICATCKTDQVEFAKTVK